MMKLSLIAILATAQFVAGLKQPIKDHRSHHGTSYFASGSVLGSLSAPLLALRPGSGTLEARDNEASATPNITSTLTSFGMVSS